MKNKYKNQNEESSLNENWFSYNDMFLIPKFIKTLNNRLRKGINHRAILLDGFKEVKLA